MIKPVFGFILLIEENEKPRKNNSLPVSLNGCGQLHDH